MFGNSASSRWCRRHNFAFGSTLLGTLLLVASCATNDDSTVTNHATIVEVVDGDTVRLRIADAEFSVRLVGVDAPETKHPTKGVQCFGPEAATFLSNMLPKGTIVRIERDVEARDVYDRLLLYLFVTTDRGERFINLELVSRGLAMPLSIEPNTRYQESFVTAAFDAQRSLRGLWRACK